MTKCEIKGCSEECEICTGETPYFYDDLTDTESECVLHFLWRERGNPNQTEKLKIVAGEQTK